MKEYELAFLWDTYMYVCLQYEHEHVYKIKHEYYM